MRLNPAALRAAAMLLAASASSAYAQTVITKANNTNNLNLGTSWTNGSAPDSNSILVWDSTVAAANTSVSLGANLSVSGLRILNPGSTVTISGNVLTLGASGIDMSQATQNLTLSSGLVIGANQDWIVAGGRSITGPAGNAVSLTGTGNINFSRSSVAGFDTGTAFVRFNSNGNGTGWGGFSGNVTINSDVTVQSEGNAAAAFGTGTIFLNGGQVAQGNGNWTWSNAIDVAAGSVIANNSSNGLGRILKLTGSITSANGASLTFTNNTTGGSRSHDVGFILAGANASTYGDTLISANSRVRVGGNGTNTVGGNGLEAGTNGSLGTGSVTLLATSAELAFTRSDSHTVANAISGTGTVVIGGTTSSLVTTSASQVVIFTGANTYSGATTIATGTLQIGAGGTTGTLGSGAVTNAGSLIFDRSDALAAANVISGAGSVTKTGAGTLTLSGNSGYSGGTTLVQGALIATNANALGTSGTVTINTAATGSSDTSLRLGSVTMGRAITVANQGSGTVTLGSNGTVALPEFSGAITLNKAVTLDGSTNSDRLTFTGGIGGTGNVTIAGTGRVVFATTANTYSGTTTISAGSILQLSTGSATAAQLIPNASVLDIGAGGFLKLAKGANNETIGGLTGTGTVRGHEGVASVASALTVSNTGDYSFGGVLENGGGSGSTLSLTKSGAGNQTLTGTSTYTGGTTISNGTLTLGHATDTLANTGAVTVSGGTLALGSNSDTIGALSLTSGAITGTGTLATSGATFNSSGDLSVDVILAGGGLTKQGANTLTLTAANTYTGATTISAGTLNLASGASLDAASAVSLASGATLTGAGNAAGAVTLASGGILSPGASNVGTLSLGALTFGAGNGDTATIQLPVSFGGTLDAAISVSGNVVANGGAGSVTFALGSNLALLAGGTYSLISYTGDQLANVDAFAFTGTTGARQSVSLDNAAGAINLNVGNAFVIWSGDQGNGWSTGNNWTLSSNNTATSYLTGDVVVFNDDASTGTVDLSANVEAATVTFTGSTLAYTVGSSNGSGITAASLAKQGAATVTLNTANTVTDGVGIADGTLVLGNSGALGTAAAQLTGGTLNLNGLTVANEIVLGGGTLAGSGATLSGVISETGGARTLVVGSDLTLTGTNTYTGGTTIDAGTLRVGAAGTSGTLGSGTVANSGTLVFDRSDNVTVSNVITGSGAITKVGNNTLTLSGISSFGGTLAVDAGRVIFSDNNSLTAAITVASGATLQVGTGATAGFIGNSATVSNAGTLEFSRTSDSNVATVISGDGAVSKIGTNTLSLNANNSISGEVTISAGTLRLGNGGTAGAVGTGNIVNNATLALNRSNTLTLGNLVSGTGALTQIGSGTSILTADNTYAGTTTITAGTLQVGDGGTTGSLGSGAVTNNAALVFNRSDSITVGNAISGTGSLTKQGNGTLTLSVANTYSGGTTVSAGTLQLGSATAMGTGAATLNGGALSSDSATARSLANNLTIGGNVTLGDATNNGALTFSGAVDLGGAARTLTVASVVTLSGGISGDGALIKNGSSTLTLAGASTFSGGTTLNAGAIQVGNATALGTGSVTLKASTTLAADANVALANAIVLDGDAILSGTGGANVQGLRLDGAISGAFNLTKQGTGRVTLANDSAVAPSTFTGSVTVSDGILATTLNALSSASAVHVAGTSAGGLAIGRNGTTVINNLTGTAGGRIRTDFSIDGANGNRVLQVNQSVDGVFAGELQQGSNRPIFLIKDGSAVLTLSGTANTYTGTTTVSAGTLAIGGAGRLNNGAYAAAIDIASGATFRFDSSASQTLSGAVSGDGTLGLSGAGTLTLSAASAFGGGIAVDAGRLVLSNNNSFTGAVTVASGATLQIGTGATAGFIGNSATVSNAGTLEFNRTSDSNVGTVISGDGAISKLGSNILSLNADNSISGEVTISTGTLRLGGGGAAGSVGSGNIVNNATLALNRSDTLTLGNLVSGTGALTQIGSGTSVLTADNTYSGATTISNGTLQVGDGGTTGTLGSGAVTNNAALVFNRSDALAVSNAISGTGSLTKQGAGTLTLDGTLSYTGATVVSAGTLALGAGASLASSSGYTINGTLDASALASFEVASGQTLGGSGTLIGDVTVAGAHTPGNSPGVQTIDGNLTYTSGATVQWELTTNTSASNLAGVEFDRIIVTGDLAFDGATALTLVFNGAGSDVNWTDAFWNAARSWTVYDVGGALTSFGNLSLTDAAAYPLDGVMTVSSVQDSTGATLASARQDAGFYLGNVGSDVRLFYRPIPEPSTYGLVLGGLALAGAAIRRRRAAKNSK